MAGVQPSCPCFWLSPHSNVFVFREVHRCPAGSIERVHVNVRLQLPRDHAPAIASVVQNGL